MKILNALLVLAITALISPAASAFTATGFSNPYGVTVDTEKNYIYVSNVNGNANARNDSGFVSRLKGDGSVDKIRFIDGASPAITLNAPKGIAVAGGRIYIADIEKLRAFDQATGKFLFDVNFGDLPVQHFYGIAVGPDKSLYVADGPANVIYRVDVQKQHEVTVFISDADLGQPHGIVWFPGRQVFAIAGWSSGKVTAYDQAGTAQIFPAILLRTLEGITADNAGNMYVASSGLGAIYRIAANFSLESFWPSVNAPMGVAFSSSGNEVVAASSETGTLESRAVPDGSEKPKPAVMDYVAPAAPATDTTAAEGAKNGKDSKAGTQTPLTNDGGTRRPSADEMQKAIEEAMPPKPSEQPETPEQQPEQPEQEKQNQGQTQEQPSSNGG
jgi:DNA-binding beta-propeller fold protein YncE